MTSLCCTTYKKTCVFCFVVVDLLKHFKIKSMTTINDILSTIDKSKMETKFVDIYPMCESEFEIYEYISQPDDDVRLTYCYYHSWICTDTMVGIRVWYFEGNPVCISSKPYRKYDEDFAWLSAECFNLVRSYALSLKDESCFAFTVAADKDVSDVVNKFKAIDYKQFEKINVIN